MDKIINNRVIEECNKFFIDCFWEGALMSGKLSEEEEYKKTIIKQQLKFKGLSDEDILRMEIGFKPSFKEIYNYLAYKGYSINQSIIKHTIGSENNEGNNYKLTVPYKINGIQKGFTFLEISNITTVNRIYSEALFRDDIFNFDERNTPIDIILVEDEIDCLYLLINNIKNVAALGGKLINQEQVISAKLCGVKSITLCLNREPGNDGPEYSTEDGYIIYPDKNLDKIISIVETIYAISNIKVYVSTLEDLDASYTCIGYAGGTRILYKDGINGQLEKYEIDCRTTPIRQIIENGLPNFKNILNFRESYGTYLGKKLSIEILANSYRLDGKRYILNDVIPFMDKASKINSKLNHYDKIEFEIVLSRSLKEKMFSEDIINSIISRIT